MRGLGWMGFSQYEERVIYGYSMGAYAAVKYSGLFQTTTSVAIAPQFSIDPADVGHFDRAYSHYFAANLHAGMAPNMSDRGGMVSYIFYDNKWPVDVEHMKLYQKAVDPILHDVPYTGHETLRPFTSSAVILRLFNACRAGDAAGLKAMVAERRKPHPIRAYHVALAAIKKHDVWAVQILQNRGTEMDRFLVHELAVRIGQAALHKGRFDLASSAYLDACRWPRDRYPGFMGVWLSLRPGGTISRKRVIGHKKR